MKALSSVILGVGLMLPQAWAVAADTPGGGIPGSDLSGSDTPAAGATKRGSAKRAAVNGKASAQAGKAGKKEAAPTVALEPDGVAFGMSADEVARLYDRWWDKQFVRRYRTTNPGPKTRELDFELAKKKKVLRRKVIFDGRTTSFDNSDFREEFAHGSDETMISSTLSRLPLPEGRAALDAKAAKEAKPVSYTRRFFFYRDQLWKIYDEYRLEPSSLFGGDFKEATARVAASLGKGARRTRGPESLFESVLFDAGKTRVRVVKLPKDTVAIVRFDAALTKEVLDRRAEQAKAGDSAGLDEDIQAVIR